MRGCQQTAKPNKDSVNYTLNTSRDAMYTTELSSRTVSYVTMTDTNL